jgi:hypothetical protein
MTQLLKLLPKYYFDFVFNVPTITQYKTLHANNYPAPLSKQFTYLNHCGISLSISTAEY